MWQKLTRGIGNGSGETAERETTPVDYRWPVAATRETRRKKKWEAISVVSLFRERDTSGVSRETPKKRQCFARKLLPRVAVHINPRLAYCFPDQEKIYVRSRYIHHCAGPVGRALAVGDEVWKEGRSRLYARAHFVLSRVAANEQ